VRITFIYRVICFLVTLTLISCTSVTNIMPEAGTSFDVQVSERYLVRFKDGSSEDLEVVRIGKFDFSDSRGHTHDFVEVERFERKEFSALKTLGFVVGGLIFLAVIGQLLVEDTLDKSTD
jgi:hypothetical protein